MPGTDIDEKTEEKINVCDYSIDEYKETKSLCDELSSQSDDGEWEHSFENRFVWFNRIGTDYLNRKEIYDKFEGGLTQHICQSKYPCFNEFGDFLSRYCGGWYPCHGRDKFDRDHLRSVDYRPPPPSPGFGGGHTPDTSDNDDDDDSTDDGELEEN